jgi:8-oxo-dGTP diphosphatase
MRMPHIHTAPGEHDHSSSAFIIRTEFEEPKIMLHRHRKLDKFMQFGGHVELLENPWESIVHELLEESGYEISQLQILQPPERLTRLTGNKLHPIPFYHSTHDISAIHVTTHFHTDLGYAFIADSGPKQQIGTSESADILLLTRQELIDLPAERTIESVREACIFALDVCLPKWQPVSTANFS